MKLTIENTSGVIEINGIPARVWEGQTENGVPVTCFITRIAVALGEDQEQFLKELQATPPMRPAEAWDLRMLI